MPKLSLPSISYEARLTLHLDALDRRASMRREAQRVRRQFLAAREPWVDVPEEERGWWNGARWVKDPAKMTTKR